jgi:flagellin
VTGVIRNGASIGGMAISDVGVNGAVAGTFTLSYASGSDTLTLTNGTTVGSVVLAETAANSSQVVNFSTLGISFRLSNGTTSAITADTWGAAAVTATATVKVSTTNPSLDFQAGADTQGENLISYNTMNVQTVATNNGSSANMTDLGSQITGMVSGAGTYTVAQWAAAFNSLGSKTDTAINHISDKRSYVGALTNRISYINENLESQSTNLQASRSAIIDTDFAAETAKLTKGQIMQQAATAMLAQANQMPNVVLSLLK